MIIAKVKKTFFLLVKSFKELKVNDPIRLSAATAFIASFALAPTIVLLISLINVILDEEMITGELFNYLEEMVGGDTAEEIQNILLNLQDMKTGGLITIGFLIFFLFVATTLFVVVQNSFNQIWKVKPKSQRRLKFMLKNRAKSLLIILITGLLFLVALLSDILVAFLGDNLLVVLPDIGRYGLRIFNFLLSLGIFTLWFASVYKFLPDVKMRWKPVWVGAVFTSILFSIGQLIMGQFLVQSEIDDVYGASGSLAILFLFIFYSSFILYFGLSFIKDYAEEKGYKIKPKKFAVRYEIREINE
ncbi:MAG: YihY/virulence factor BrkB family protein [Cytophagaceae bacterium]